MSKAARRKLSWIRVIDCFEIIVAWNSIHVEYYTHGSIDFDTILVKNYWKGCNENNYGDTAKLNPICMYKYINLSIPFFVVFENGKIFSVILLWFVTAFFKEMLYCYKYYWRYSTYYSFYGALSSIINIGVYLDFFNTIFIKVQRHPHTTSFTHIVLQKHLKTQECYPGTELMSGIDSRILVSHYV